jgi:hypothetical protein
MTVVGEVVNGGDPVVDLTRFDHLPNWMFYVHPLMHVVRRCQAVEPDEPHIVDAARVDSGSTRSARRR